ncbi:MAG: hypothetical protein L0Y76_03695 [Ignavibacteria bacterium]|nr:hypothetical protein [Ignavibacteria bacterium]
MSELYIENDLLQAVFRKFLPEKFAITAEGKHLKLTVTQVFIFEVHIDIYLALSEIRDSEIIFKVERISYEKMGIEKFIKSLEDKINKEINRKTPGLITLSYPLIKIDLSKVMIKDDVHLTDIVAVKNIEINNSVRISFDPE